MNKLFSAILSIGLVSSLIISVTFAHGADIHATVRHNMMKFIGSEMRLLGSIARGGQDFNQAYITSVGKSISIIAEMLPLTIEAEDMRDHNSDAADTIWQNPDGFMAATIQLRDAARNLSQSTETDFRDSFMALSGTCRSCHSVFRK